MSVSVCWSAQPLHHTSYHSTLYDEVPDFLALLSMGFAAESRLEAHMSRLDSVQCITSR